MKTWVLQSIMGTVQDLNPTASAVIADLVDIANGGWPSQELSMILIS